MKTSQHGIDLIKEYEGFRARAYRDPVGIWTIGYGFTRGVQPGDTITRAEAEIRLRRELIDYERGVLRATGGRATQPQFDALVSFAFNVGVAGMARSTVIKRHNEGSHQAAARAFALWNKAGGREWPGLTRRRAAEAALYLTPEVVHQPLPTGEDMQEAVAAAEMPRQIEPERPIVQSEINRAAVATGATATAATVAEVARTAADVKTSADLLGDWLLPLVLLAIIGALCVYIVLQRRKQRAEGWA